MPTKVHIVKAMVFPVVMYGYESWTIKKGECRRNRCFRTVVLEKTLESPLDSKEIKPVNPKGNQPGIFTGKADAEAEAPILSPPDAKSWLIGKDPDVGKDWRQDEKGRTDDEMVGWHHRLNGHEFEQFLRDGEGQGRLVCCSPWGNKELDMTEQLNNNSNNKYLNPQHKCKGPVAGAYLCVSNISHKFLRTTQQTYWVLSRAPATHLVPILMICSTWCCGRAALWNCWHLVNLSLLSSTMWICFSTATIAVLFLIRGSPLGD